MLKEVNWHPSHRIINVLYSIDDSADEQIWWQGADNVLRMLSDYSNTQSLASTCWGIAVYFLARSEVVPAEQLRIQRVLDNELVPLWERELEKDDLWMRISGNVYGFYEIVGGEKAQKWFERRAQIVRASLPSYEALPILFPDEQLPVGLVDVEKIAHLFALNDDIGRIIQAAGNVSMIVEACERQEWENEKNEWMPIYSYFQNLLLHVDLSSIHPTLVEGMYEFITSLPDAKNIVTRIAPTYQAWKFARNFFHGDDERYSANLIM